MLECGIQQLHHYSVGSTMFAGEKWLCYLKELVAHLSLHSLAEHHSPPCQADCIMFPPIWCDLIYDGVLVAHPACVTQSHVVCKERLAFCLISNRFSAHTTQMLVSGVALGISPEIGDPFLSLQMEVKQQPGCQLRWTPVVIYSCMQAGFKMIHLTCHQITACNVLMLRCSA